MKNLKTKWNFWNMFEKSCDRVVKLQTAWEALCGIVAMSVWATDYATPIQMLIGAIAAFAVNKAIGGIYFEDETYKGKV
jgi:hypothetical protein